MIQIKLCELLESKNKTRYWLSKQTRLDSNAINKIYKNKSTQIKLDTLDKICTALDCNIQDILQHIK